jgi:MoaA/NifB/PqqE/SkfB family radical SAM enzyme
VKPLVCNYYITLRCNDTCEFCDIWQRKEIQDSQEAGIDGIKKILRELKDVGVYVINFTGGEPLLRDDLPEILRASKRLGFFNILTTNGIEYPEKAAQVTGLVDHLLFSLDSPSPEEHNRIRGVGCFEAVMEGIKIAKKLGKLPFINFTVTRDSIQNLPEMADMAQNLGVLLWINPVYNWAGFEGFDKRSIDYIRRYFGRKNVALNLASMEVLVKGGNDDRRPVCSAGDSTITLLPDNSLVLPCFYMQRSVIKIDEKLRDLLKRREVQASVRVHGRDAQCKGCMAWPYLNPSFLHRLDKKLFLALYSLWSLFWKELNLKKGEIK